MGHSAPVWDCRAAAEITQDWNGIDQVVLRNPKGASARVSFLLPFSWLWTRNHNAGYSLLSI